MKVQIYAGAILKACERRQEVLDKNMAEYLDTLIKGYLKPYKPSSEVKTVTTGWWLWKKSEVVQFEKPEIQRTQSEAEALAQCDFDRIKSQQDPSTANNLYYIARHKRPETLIEMTAEELAPIAKYLSVYESERI